MKSRCFIVLALALFSTTLRADSIDGRVVQIKLPIEDVTLYYVEAKGGMAVELRGSKTSVMGTKFYVGDGEVAVLLEVVHGRGILFQGKTELEQGFVFKKSGDVKVLPGYKKAADLKPGDVYITLTGMGFEVPEK